MEKIDWDQPASLEERSDGGSDLYFEFRTVAKGSVAELVAQVLALTPAERARLVIDCGAGGTFNMSQIMALAARPDYPGAAA